MFYSHTEANCSSALILAPQISTLTFTYVNQAPPPPGGDPPVQDNNLIAYLLTWDNGLAGPAQRTHDFPSMVTIRSSAYTNLQTGMQNPLLNISPPPAECP